MTYVESRLPSGSTLITAGQSYNALSYGLPGWDVRLTDHFGEAGLAQAMAAGTWDYVVVADPEALRPDERYVELETVTFTRDPQIHAKHARVVANIYGRADALSGHDFALPPDGTIRIGTPADGKYVLGGWYRREEIGGLPARWTGDGDEAQLRLLLPAEAASSGCAPYPLPASRTWPYHATASPSLPFVWDRPGRRWKRSFPPRAAAATSNRPCSRCVRRFAALRPKARRPPIAAPWESP